MVIMSLFRTVSDTNGDLCRKSQILISHPRVFNAPAEGVPLEIIFNGGSIQNTRFILLSDDGKSLMMYAFVSICNSRV